MMTIVTNLFNAIKLDRAANHFDVRSLTEAILRCKREAHEL